MLAAMVGLVILYEVYGVLDAAASREERAAKVDARMLASHPQHLEECLYKVNRPGAACRNAKIATLPHQISF